MHMLPNTPSDPHLGARLRRVMFMRLLFVTLLLGVSLFVQIRGIRTPFGEITAFHYLLIAGIYGLSIVYAGFFRFSKGLHWQAYVQVLFDTVFVTGLIYTTGGIESLFSFLYLLVIYNASLLLYREGGFIIATCSSIAYGLLLDLHYYNIIHPPGSTPGDGYPGYQVLYTIAVNMSGFYLVAYLSSTLAEQVRRSHLALNEKQRDLDKLEMLNESIIQSMNSALIALDEERRVILFNPAAEKLFQETAAELLGKSLEEALPQLHGRLEERGLASWSPSRDPIPAADFPYPTTHGETRFIRLTFSPLEWPSQGHRGCILVLQDMTRSKRIEDEMKRMEGLALIGELAASIAHEIRNPLASISGSIQLLKDEFDQDGIHGRLLNIVVREIERLNHLVRDFQQFARPKKTSLQSLDLIQVITESLELVRNNPLWPAEIQVSTALPSSLVVESDPEQIRQVFWNLFLNACEAMPQGGHLEVRAQNTADSGGELHARVTIRDTGPGFPPEVLPKVFIPFFTTKEEGSGLGLAIVKGIVEDLKGDIEADNHPEGGAVITLTFPSRGQKPLAPARAARDPL